MAKIKMVTCVLTMACISACTVGPDYVRPSVAVPEHFKETPKGWKKAEPRDVCPPERWWTQYHDEKLNELEAQLQISNQTIVAAVAQYDAARGLVDEARANYFPTIAASASLTRQRTVPTVTSNNSNGSSARANTATTHELLLDASWEPDIWGSVRRTVEASVANAESVQAALGATQLSAQASLAQYYFELRGLDQDQALLDSTVASDRDALQLTENQYHAGVVAESDIILARTQLEQAEALAINNGVNRAIYEHAIAVLIGVPASNFSLARSTHKIIMPVVPVGVPSSLLERRPDVAEEERLIAQANAQIGIAISAYYPSLTLSATGSVTHTNYANWFSVPALAWALGAQLSETIMDGGLRDAQVAVARAGYRASVANYKQTVLAAFQDVEDNLAAVRILGQQASVTNEAARDARDALRITTNQYKAGTVAYANVITAQTTAFNAEKSAVDINYLRISSSIGLIKALGGSWKS